MKKQMFFGFVIIAVAAIMLTSQTQQAFAAADTECIDGVFIDGDTGLPLVGKLIQGKLIIKAGSTFNICVLDGVTVNGEIIVEENAALFIYNGSTLDNNIKLEGKLSAVNFEGIQTNLVKGNIETNQDTYLFLDSVTINGNVKAKGEVYFNSSTRDTGNILFKGDLIIEKSNETDEFVLEGGTVQGNVLINGQLVIRITDTEIRGNLLIKENTNDEDSIVIIDNILRGDVTLEKNTASTIEISGNVMEVSLLLKDNNGQITLEGNTITLDLECSGNSLDPLGNSDAGKSKKDQCAGIADIPPP